MNGPTIDGSIREKSAWGDVLEGLRPEWKELWQLLVWLYDAQNTVGTVSETVLDCYQEKCAR